MIKVWMMGMIFYFVIICFPWGADDDCGRDLHMQKEDDDPRPATVFWASTCALVWLFIIATHQLWAAL